MGPLRSSLTALCVAALLAAGTAAAAAEPAPGCLACHSPHFPARGRCMACHRGDERTNRKNIAHRNLIPGAYASFTQPDSPAVRRGTGRIEAFACRRCHRWLGDGNALAANLDDLLAVSPPRGIHEAIRTPAVFMPDFGFDEAQITEIVTAILAGGARRTRTAEAEIPRVVHFEDAGAGADLPFARICGPCHKILSEAAGGLGAGTTGPNLSGLLSRHYPKTFGGRERWTRDNLRKWLENPRTIRPAASMPPVRLSPNELESLTILMAPSGERAR